MTSRYYIGYSRNSLTIRDRITNQSKTFNHITEDIANIYINAIKTVNYDIDLESSSDISELNIETESKWLSQNQPQRKLNWGEFPPVNMKWESQIKKSKIQTDSKSTTKRIEKSINQLDKLLGLN